MKIRNKINLATVILILINTISCTTLPDGKPTVEISPTATVKRLENPTALSNQNWVIFPKERSEEMGVASWLVESDELWTPTEDEILRLEGEIAGYLSQNSNLFYHQPPVWQRLDEYQRQYIGFERGGAQFIYGNYFCNNLGIKWREELVIVEDGGECYFQVEYDVESGLFIELRVNGES